MKKYITSVLLMVLITSYGFAQVGWFSQNPLPTENYLQKTYFINSNTGFICGSCNTLFKTTNGGVNWLNINSEYFDSFTHIQFLDENLGFVGGYNFLLKTIDGGENWNYCYVGGITTSYFLNGMDGFAATTNHLIKRTQDGGSNWITVTTNFDSYMLHFFNQNTGISCRGNIYKTTNGGNNWISVSPNYNIRYVNFVNDFIGFATADDGNILKTTDSGDNWVLRPTGISESLNSVSFADQNTGYATSYYSKVLKTTNGGNTWLLNYTANSSIQSISVINNTGYICGGGGLLYKTSNSGDTWISLKSGNSNRHKSLSFPSSSIGYCVGTSGSILNTTNSGELWSPQTSGVTLNLNSVSFVNSIQGYVACDSGIILKTSNGGLNWMKIITGAIVNLNTILCIDPYVAIIAGNNGLMMKTENGGNNWNTLNTGTPNSLKSLYFVNNIVGYCAGFATVIKTIDGGVTWNTVFMNTASSISLNSVSFIDLQTGFVAGSKQANVFPYNIESYLIKTTNGGSVWSEQIVPNSGTLNSIYFIGSNNGYLVGGTVFYRTTNNGLNWITQNCISPPIAIFYDVKFTSLNTGYIVSDRGMIFKTTDGGAIVEIINEGNSTPLNFSLQQNYPNPFNPQTKIKFDVPKASFTKLVIYDLLGKEVATLVNEELRPGTYEADWDASSFSSGVYFYRIVSGEFTETKKMVLMK